MNSTTLVIGCLFGAAAIIRLVIAVKNREIHWTDITKEAFKRDKDYNPGRTVGSRTSSEYDGDDD